MIAQELEVSLHMAFMDARQKRHEFITVEHLLLALLDNPSAAEVLRACSANIDDLRKSSMSAAHARSTSDADGLSSSASSRCSTVMNSWRFCLASMKAMCRLTSSSWAIIYLFFPPSIFFHYAL